METTQNNSKLRTTPKDFFLYLGSIVTLYLSVISILNLIFAIIDQLFPKLFQYVDPYASGVSVALSILIVAFPLYLVFMRVTTHAELENPEKRELPVRKWLIFLTLFIAGLVIAIDLMVLLQKFFAGEEITLGFVLKVLSIIFVLAAVFGYYLYDIRHGAESDPRVGKRFAWGSGIFVVAAIVFGFVVMGSPYTQKEKRLDAERVSNLQSIQSQVISYWQTKQTIPATLDDLKDPLSGFVVPVDPKTQAQYEYTTKGKLSFELCATFSREASANSASINGATQPVSTYKDALNENWQHTAGRVCYDRTIDPERYKLRDVLVPAAVPAMKY